MSEFLSSRNELWRAYVIYTLTFICHSIFCMHFQLDSHELQFSLSARPLVRIFNMHLSSVLGFEYFVAQWAWVAITNRVFPLKMTLYLAESSLRIATQDTDEAI